MILNETYKLYNEVEIPKLGFGTWLIKNDVAAEAVQQAISVGYRHIDTAQAYNNEEGVGIGIKNSGIKREELFITTKIAAEIKNYEEAINSIDVSLEKLQLDYVDLMIIHSPKPWKEFLNEERFLEGNREAWRALEEAYKAGKIKAIGLSNFEKADIENILEHCHVRPMINQVLAHISNTPLDLLEYCTEQSILVEAYSPIGHGELLKNEEVKAIAAKYNVSAAQLGIRYCLELGMIPLPKTTNPDHMKANTEVDFEISLEDLEKLRTITPIKDYGDHSRIPVFGKDRN